MILFILFVALLIVGLAGVIICKVIDDHSRYVSPEWLSFTSWCLFGLGLVAIVCCLIIIACVQPAAQLKYEQCLYEKEVLEARLDQLDENPDAVGNELLYRDIIDFNNNLRNVKRWGSSKWVNWYNNMIIAENVDYIDLPILTQGGD